MQFKKIAAATLSVGVMVPAFVFAQTSTSSIQSLLDQIRSLNQQILQIQQQQQAVMLQLATTLQQGANGENVKILQQLLAQDSSIFPEARITGYYGRLTAKAVTRFQLRWGLPQVGNVGPRTLKKLNEIFARFGTTTKKEHKEDDGDDNDRHEDGDDKDSDRHEDRDDHDRDKRPCVVPPGHLIAPGYWKNFVLLGRDHNGRPCTATSTPPVSDTTPPTLSDILATNVTTTGALIMWSTNEAATSQVEFGTTTSYSASTTLNASLVGSHSVLLSGLSTSTTYHFRVISKDAAGNMASSGDYGFTTVTPDTTPPNIFGVSVSPIASTTASVNWSTNEAATSKVYFATSTPFDLAAATSVSNSTLLMGHILGLTGLSATTTYYYVIESRDLVGNTATTSAASFVTTN